MLFTRQLTSLSLCSAPSRALRSGLPVWTGRFLSTDSNLKALDSKLLEVIPSTKPKPIPSKDKLVFGKYFSDHMIVADWDASEGWGAPKLQPYGPLSLDPSSVVFHYGFECFEGMKAYKDKKGKTRIFRPEMNFDRMNRSCERIALPKFSSSEAVELLKELLRKDQAWIPEARGYSLYIRPTMIGTQNSLGVSPSDQAKFFMFTSPVGPYYKTGFNAVSLLADPSLVRAWPGGVGYAKIGGNYAPCVTSQIEAAKKGYQQNIWLFGSDHAITEIGTMNCFVFWKNEKGEKELITPELDGTILHGVTRDSIIQLTKSWGEFPVREGRITMKDVKKALQDDRLIEVFGAGTACIVSPVKKIHYQGEDLNIPLDPKDPSSQAGPLARRINDTLLDIQYGEIEHPWSVVVD